MTALTACPLTGLTFTWHADGQRLGVTYGRRDYGIQRADGAWLTLDGLRPYCPRGGKSAASEVAATVNPTQVGWLRPDTSSRRAS